jgi:pimeloyl-ACP methyl ester carboxylesterase
LNFLPSTAATFPEPTITISIFIFNAMKLAQKLAVGYLRTKFRMLTAISKKKAAEKAFDLFCTPQSRNKKKLPKIFEEAEQIQFQFENQRIHGYRWNHPAERKLMIIHGFESSVINFERYVKPLTRKGYEVLAFDAPAHGRSTGKSINAVMYKDFIKEVYQNYGPVQSFLAHSLGGLALCLALEEIKHDQNYRVALIAPATETTTAIDHFFRFLRLDPALYEEFEKRIIELGGKPTAWYSIRRALKNIRAKVLWFHDEEDNVTLLSDAMKVKEENYSNVEFVITKGLGHQRIYRDNKVSRAVIEFL